MKIPMYLIVIFFGIAIAKLIFASRKNNNLETAQAKLSRHSLDIQKLKSFLIDKASEQCGKGIRNDELALKRLNECAEKSLFELKENGKSEINLPFLAADQSGPKHFNISINVSEFI